MIAVVGGAFVAIRAHDNHETEVRAERAAAAAQAQQAAEAHAVQQEKSEMSAGLVLLPKSGTTGVAPDAVVTVSTSVGQLRSVVADSTTGEALPGALAPGATSWKSTGVLQPGSRYEVKAEVVAPGGISISKSSAFTVLTPTAEVTANVFPTSDMTVGVGQPVVVTFDQPIYTASSRQSVLSHFGIAESKPVPGGWYWFSPYELHFRPETFWPADEQIESPAT